MSAHRTPDLLFEYAAGARARGLEVIIAGAGGAAHLPGMTAAKTTPAGARRAGAVEGPRRPRLAAVDRADARRDSGGDLRHRRRRRQQRGAVRRGHPRQPAPRRSRRRSRRSAASRPPPCSPVPIRARTRAHDHWHRGRRPARPHARFGGLSARPRFPVPGPGGRCARRPGGAAPHRRLHGPRAARASSHGAARWSHSTGRTCRWRACAPWSGACTGRASPRRWRRSQCAQDRVSEKRLFARLAIPTTRWRAVDSRAAARARPSPRSGCRACSRPAASATTARARRCCAPAADAGRAWQRFGSAPLLYEEWVPFDCEVSVIGARGARGEVAIYPLCGNVHARGILRLTCAPYGPRRWQSHAGRYLERVLEHFRYTRRAHHRVLRAPRAADRQRDGPAGAQLRALDHRGRGHQPVREPPARDPGSAARRDPRARPQRHDQPDRQHARRGARLLATRGRAPARLWQASRARGARWGIAPWSSRPPPGGTRGRGACSRNWPPGCASRNIGREAKLACTSNRSNSRSCRSGSARTRSSFTCRNSMRAPRRTWSRPSGSPTASW